MKYLIIACVFCIALACNTTKSAENNTTTTEKETTDVRKVISFAKGACHGTCPIYNMIIFSDGQVVYEGIRFSDLMGKHTKMLDEKTINDLMTECKNANLTQFPDKYESRIPDLPSSTMMYEYQDGTSKTIFWREKADDVVKNLGRKIEGIANNPEGWAMDKDQELPAGAIPDQMILNLQQGVEAETFAAKYRANSMKVVERIHNRGNYWLFSYDDSTIEPFLMLQNLNKDEEVVMAEFNRQITPRN